MLILRNLLLADSQHGKGNFGAPDPRYKATEAILISAGNDEKFGRVGLFRST